MGDEAILACLIDQLRQMNLDNRLVVFSGNPAATTKIHRVHSVPSILPSSFRRFVIGILGRNRANFFRSLRTFKAAETLIVGGGGLFLDRPQTNKHLLQLLHTIKWAKRLKQKVILLGVGVGPVHMKESRLAISNILNTADLITVRDNESHNLLTELGVTIPDIHVTADFAFLMKPEPLERLTKITRLEKLNGREGPKIAICMRGADLNVMNLRRAVKEFAEYALRQLKARLWFVPLQTGGGEDDHAGAESVINELGAGDNARLLGKGYTPRETMGLLAQMDAVIGEKLHAIIFAINSQVPVIGISYQAKVENLFREIDHEEWCLSLSEMRENSIIAKFSHVWVEREQIKKELKSISASMQKRSMMNFTLLAQVLEASRI
jgi:polysaccharide pyruvyl transferase CsaB